MNDIYTNAKTIKSPLNYIGGKSKLLNQIRPLLPKEINTFVDLFAGGCNVGINISSNKVIFNDNLIFLIEMYKSFQKLSLDLILNHIESKINDYNLSIYNESGYLELRKNYNLNKNPLDLFVLIAFSFNHQIRFNNSHQFNNPFGKDRSSFNYSMRRNLIKFVLKLKEIDCEFQPVNFDEFDFSFLDKEDFVYCDPPYFITNGTYNDGKRGFTGWTQKEELKLLEILDSLNEKGIKFALSNVISHKTKENEILQDWLKNSYLHVNYLNYNYSNSSYQTKNRDKKSSIEVLITNYDTNIYNEKIRLF